MQQENSMEWHWFIQKEDRHMRIDSWWIYMNNLDVQQILLLQILVLVLESFQNKC